MKKTVLTLVTFAMLTQALAQKTYQEHVYENGRTYLLGPIDPLVLRSPPYTDWFVQHHDSYTVDATALTTVGTALKDYHILVFMGTWCGDSKQELPRFLKILESVAFPSDRLKIVAVDRRKEFYKKSPLGEEWGLNIARVPTFIFLKEGKEVNRIVESPIESLEKDLANIVLGRPYRPKYSQ